MKSLLRKLRLIRTPMSPEEALAAFRKEFQRRGWSKEDGGVIGPDDLCFGMNAGPDGCSVVFSVTTPISENRLAYLELDAETGAVRQERVFP